MPIYSSRIALDKSAGTCIISKTHTFDKRPLKGVNVRGVAAVSRPEGGSAGRRVKRAALIAICHTSPSLERDPGREARTAAGESRPLLERQRPIGRLAEPSRVIF